MKATSAPSVARKVVISKAGSYDQLQLKDVPLPALGANQVQIEVKAAGINYADVIVRMGLYASAKELVGWPITPGFEVSGMISAVGSDVTNVQVGDEVLAATLFGGYTSVLVTGSEYVYKKPESLSFEQAAGLPAVFMTAWFALFNLAHPRPGDTILIHSAAGGVGSSLVQMARIAGCTVVGVVGRSQKVDAARAFGCHHVIDKSTQDLWAEAERYAPGGYDVVCDANGVATLKDSYEHLRSPGKLVVYGFHTMMPKKGGKPNWFKLASGFLRTPRFSPLEMTNNSRSVMAFNLSYLFGRADIMQPAMEEIFGWLEEGKLKGPMTTSYPLNDVAKAHSDIESGKTIGKLILIP